MNKIMKSVKGVTNIVVPLLTLAILLSLLVGPANMLFLGDVTGNIINLISQLGRAGLAGLIALGVILHLLQDGWCSCDESS
tara:strand:- start:123 stop:365 length:243 start_codon:yes stop_codon:yes gene_type:complete